MKRLLLLLLSVILVVQLAGCGESDEEKFNKTIGQRVEQLERRVQQARVAKTSLDSDLNKVQSTAIQLQSDAKSLQSSIEQLSTSLATLEEELGSLKKDQQAREKALHSGGWLKWLIVLVILGAVGYLAYWILKPKAYEEEEGEDFSSFDEDLGFDESADSKSDLPEDDDDKPRP